MNCDEILELKDKWVHGELNVTVSEAIDSHLCSCPECKAVYCNEKQFSDLIVSSAPNPSDRIASSVLSAIKKEKKAETHIKLCRITKYASFVAMLVLVFGISFVYLFHRTFSLFPVNAPVNDVDIHSVSLKDDRETLSHYLAGYPGSVVVIEEAEEKLSLFDSYETYPEIMDIYTIFTVSGNDVDDFLSVCKKAGIHLSEIHDDAGLSDDIEFYRKNHFLSDGDIVVCLRRNE